MKVIPGLFAVAILIVMVSGQAPNRFFNNQQFNQRQRQNFGFQRQEQQPADAPYPPSGWRPQGAAFTLPARQQQQQPEDQYGPPPPPPDSQYGAPAQPDSQYGAPAQPDNQYGPPPQSNQVEPRKSRTTTESNQEQTTDSPQSEVENLRSEKLRSEKQVESVFKNTDRGFYYVYLPDGRLQRVLYTTSADLQNMAYTARVRYEDVDPVSAPIYSAAAVNGAPVAPLIAQPAPLIPAASQRLILQ